MEQVLTRIPRMDQDLTRIARMGQVLVSLSHKLPIKTTTISLLIFIFNTSSFQNYNLYQFFFAFFLFFCSRMAGISQTRTISHYNSRRESFALCNIALLCGTYQPRLCALKLLPKEFTGGSLFQ